MKKTIASFFLILFYAVTIWAKPLPIQPKHTVIIDTDGAIDDMRAISILLSRPEIFIKGFITTDGSLNPHETYVKLKSLLRDFNIDTILVASGNYNKNLKPPVWRKFNQGINWGSKTIEEVAFPATWLNETLSNCTEPVTYICLGPFSSLDEVLKSNPGIATKIKRVIWYNSGINPMKGFNFDADKDAAETVLNSGIRVDIISNLNLKNAVFDTLLFNLCKDAPTQLAQALYFTHNQSDAAEKLTQNHFRFCDELTAIYLTNPELFDITPNLQQPKIRYNQNYDVVAVRNVISDMITGAYTAEKNIVFSEFPKHPEMFAYDLRQIMDSVITRYGNDEWKACVMTDEFHGHLGVYSIVGAKMGIKAREIFGVGPDVLEAVSYAGLKPPYSCLTDGIQASTGATLGMGTIKVVSDSAAKPMATFTYKGKSIKLTLKKEYLDKVEADIKEGITKFGLLDDGYWKLVRKSALRYWLEWDRNVIFTIEETD